jgi:hypothetical protein
MRTRSRTTNHKGLSGGGSYQDFEPPYPPGPVIALPSSNISIVKTVENMTDELAVTADGQSRAKQRRREAQLSRQLRKLESLSGGIGSTAFSSERVQRFLDVHRCVHTKRSISFEDVVHKARNQISGDRYRLFTYRHCNGDFLLLPNILGSDGANSGRWNAKNYSAEAYRSHDWFALLDQFHEATNSLIPSSTLIGESIYEHAIFVDAFKFVLNPSSILKRFLMHLKAHMKLTRKRGLTLGDLRGGIRSAANTYLGYQFGVRPAVEEVKRALTAHQVVQGRLNWLSNNAGSYVPVRVRSKLDSPFVNEDLPGYGISNTKVLCDEKAAVATISAWCKVREDLNYAKQWQAYTQYFGLQKVVGLAWELVPLSFVVDWFTNAEDYLNRFASPPTVNPFYAMRGLCHSVKQYTKETLWVGPGYRYTSDGAVLQEPSTAFKSCSLTTSSYTRMPSLPSSSGSVDFSNLGLFHYITLGIMLLQKKL